MVVQSRRHVTDMDTPYAPGAVYSYAGLVQVSATPYARTPILSHGAYMADYARKYNRSFALCQKMGILCKFPCLSGCHLMTYFCSSFSVRATP